MPEENDISEAINPKTPIKLTIGMLVLLAGNIITVVTEHVSTRKDLDVARQDLSVLKDSILKDRETIYTLRLEQTRLKQNIDDFLNTYDRDFNRYIRDKADRPSRDRSLRDRVSVPEPRVDPAYQ